MFYWDVFWILLFFSLPGIYFFIPGTVEYAGSKIQSYIVPTSHVLKIRVLKKIALVEVTIVFTVLIAIGVWLSPVVNARFVFFHALAEGKNILQSISFQSVPGFVFGTIGGLLSVGLYHFIGARHIRERDAERIMAYRNRLGIMPRILYGAFSEEIFVRWGLFSLFYWAFISAFGYTLTSFVTALVLIAVVNALGHLPAALASGLPRYWRALLLISYDAFLYSIVCGYLFWKYGLLSAIIARVAWILLRYLGDLVFYKEED